MPYMNALVAGVFLSVSVAHLLPHAVETGEEMGKDLNGFPAVFVVVMAGYLAIYFVEQVSTHTHSHVSSARAEMTALHKLDTKCTTPSLIPTVNGNTVRSFSTHGQQSAAKGSSTTVSRWDI
jgi:zinc transporter ZupT